MTDHHANRAKSLLSHYLRMAVQSSGQRWDSDNNAEVDDIVDSIIDAATATPAQPDKPAFRPDWLELPNGGWVRLSEIYLVDIARDGSLNIHLRCRADSITIDADDPLLGVFLDALIYDMPPGQTDDSYLGS